MNAKYVLGLVMLLLSLNSCAGAPTSHFSVQVVDENGTPVEGANVAGGFSTLMRDYVPGSGVQAMTNAEGKAEISGPAYFSVHVDAEKEGYYRSGKKIAVNQKQDQDVSILLRPKRNPIAMYVKKTILGVTETRRMGEQFEYDLVVGDFVYPHGKGKVNDLIITHTGQRKDSWNYTHEMTVKFSNPNDGLIPFFINKKFRESDFKSIYTAPNDDYQNEWVINDSREGVGKPIKGNRDTNRNYFFRIRAKADKDGNVEAAYYGKIYGEFPTITYYLNPTINDRSLEFDPSQNLFKNLKHLEKVGIP